MRGARLVLVGAALAAGTVLAPAPTEASSPVTTPPESSVPTTTAAAPTGPVIAPVDPSGSALGGIERDRSGGDWDLRRIALATGLTVAALAIAGHVYGRLQSVAPRVGRTIRQP